MSWQAEYLASGLRLELPVAALSLFRILFAASCLLKFAVEARRGHWSFFRPGSYLHFVYHARRLPELSKTGYQALYALKTAAAAAVLLGVAVRPALFALAFCLAVDLAVYFKFHLNLMFLFAAALAVSPDAGSGLTLPELLRSGWRETLADAAARPADPYAAVLITLTMAVVYAATAWRKCNRGFLGGTVVAAQLAFVWEERRRRKGFDFVLPAFLRRRIVDCGVPEAARRLAPFMWTVVVLEFALPALLLSPAAFPAAAAVGTLLHAAFMLLYPATLAHFSLLSVATYVLFADPRWVARLLAP